MMRSGAHLAETHPSGEFELKEICLEMREFEESAGWLCCAASERMTKGAQLTRSAGQMLSKCAFTSRRVVEFEIRPFIAPETIRIFAMNSALPAQPDSPREGSSDQSDSHLWSALWSEWNRQRQTVTDLQNFDAAPNSQDRQSLLEDLHLRQAKFDNLLRDLACESAELRQRLRDAELQARVDPLTGLWNRSAFEDQIQRIVALARRQQESLSLLLIDVDRFKHINDTYGHSAGDAVLRQLARSFQKTARRSDLIARWGGDEFTVLLPATGSAGAFTFAERLAHDARSIDVPGSVATVTLSIGVATLRDDEGPLQLRESADAAMYRAKQSGGNQAG